MITLLFGRNLSAPCEGPQACECLRQCLHRPEYIENNLRSPCFERDVPAEKQLSNFPDPGEQGVTYYTDWRARAHTPTPARARCPPALLRTTPRDVPAAVGNVARTASSSHVRLPDPAVDGCGEHHSGGVRQGPERADRAAVRVQPPLSQPAPPPPTLLVLLLLVPPLPLLGECLQIFGSLY